MSMLESKKKRYGFEKKKNLILPMKFVQVIVYQVYGKTYE